MRSFEDDDSPTVTLDDVCDYNEILLTDAENRRRTMPKPKKKHGLV